MTTAKTKQTCVLALSITRKSGKTMLKMRSDVLEDIIKKQMGAEPRATALGETASRRYKAEGLRIWGANTSTVLALAGNVKWVDEDGGEWYAHMRGLDYTLLYDSHYCNLSVLMLKGLKEGIELELMDVYTEDFLKAWCTIAKAWATKVYNNTSRGYEIAVQVSATELVVLDQEGAARAETPARVEVAA